MATRTYYQILGITPDANEREVKRAYHRLARTLHPDKAATPEDARKMEAEFAPISRAYNVLKDRQKREEYDAQLVKATSNEASAEEKPARSAKPFSAASATASAAASETKSDPGAKTMRRTEEGAISARSSIARKAFARGMQFFNAGEFGKAVEYFEAAINNDENEGLYYSRLSRALIHAKRSFTRAREMSLKAIELDPYNVEYRLVLGEICEMAGSTSLAMQAYKDVLRWDAENQRALGRLHILEKGQKNSLLDRMLAKFRK